MYQLCYIFLLFLMYSTLGWIVEMIYTAITTKKITNRGFLIGPYCPIYGYGILLIIYLLKDYTENILVFFVLATVICMILEYLTSYFMELIFATRWWDYSDKRFNINGRICLETAIPFGLGGITIMYVINPLFTSVLNRLSEKSIIIIGLILFIIFLIDNIISLIVILKFKKVTERKNKDSTAEINNYTAEYLTKSSRFIKRLILSFPNLKVRERIKHHKKSKKVTDNISTKTTKNPHDEITTKKKK